jgi:hypothetical protein
MTLADIKHAYGLRTADEIQAPANRNVPAPGAKPAYGGSKSNTLTDLQAAKFRELAPWAVYVAGNIQGPEPRFFGDNAGAWPILLGKSRSWHDTVTEEMDRYSPIKTRGMLFRLWTPGYADANRLLAGIDGLIRSQVDQLRGRWLDFGPDTDVALFRDDVREVAKRIKVSAWDDGELRCFLDQLIAEEQAAAAAYEETKH